MPQIAFALLELCGSLAENNVQRTCLLEWVVCLTVAASASEDVDSDCSFKNLLCFLRKWSVRFVVLPLYFRIVLTGHNLHATLVLSTGPSFSFKKPKWFHTLDFAFLFGTISKDSSQAMFSFWEKAIEQLDRMSQCFLEGENKMFCRHFECGQGPGGEFRKQTWRATSGKIVLVQNCPLYLE